MAIRWNIDPVLFQLGPLKIRWYGLFFMSGLLLGMRAMARAFERRKLPAEHASALMLWLPVGLIIGAHLVHLIFYEPRSFIDNPIRIIQFGLGLASHGGGLGTAIALAIYCRRKKASFHQYGDCVAIGATWIVPFVRIGNFFNSEIFGRETDLPWGVIFERRHFDQPRHPSQLYEALIGFAIVGLIAFVERRYRKKLQPGTIFYLMLTLYFVTRFLIEYVKEYQVLSTTIPLTMGQILSIPLALLCFYMLVFHKRAAIGRR